MKKILILICFNFLMCQLIFSQKIESTIYFKSGAVKSGLLDISNIKRNYLYLKNEQGNYEDILPDLILRIQMADSLDIFTEEVKYEDQKKSIFVRAIVNAPISLYVGNIDENNEIYYIQDSLLNKNRIKLNKKAYATQIQTMYSDCNVKRKYGYNQYNLSRYITEINACKQHTITKYEENTKTPKWNVDVGLSVSHYSQKTLESGWYAPLHLPTKDFKAIKSTPIALFARLSMADRLFLKVGLQYFKFTMLNDSLYRVIFINGGSWRRVGAKIDYSIAKIRIPLTIGYNLKLSKKSSFIGEAGFSIVLDSRMNVNKDFPEPYTSVDSYTKDNRQNLNLQAIFAYRYKVSKFLIEPFIKFENSQEDTFVYTPNHSDVYSGTSKNTIIKYRKFEYGISIYYRLK
jgi:hypothetical protein